MKHKGNNQWNPEHGKLFRIGWFFKKINQKKKGRRYIYIETLKTNQATAMPLIPSWLKKITKQILRMITLSYDTSNLNF